MVDKVKDGQTSSIWISSEYSKGVLSYDVKVFRNDEEILSESDWRTIDPDEARRLETYMMAEALTMFRNMM